MEIITHPAVVTAVFEKAVRVKIDSCAACSGCAVRGYCSTGETKEKIFTIQTPEAASYAVGEVVELSVTAAQGLRAVFYMYLLPLILFLAAIALVSICGGSDFYSGISGIIVLIPYYFVIFLLKNRFQKDFQFKISKKNSL